MNPVSTIGLYRSRSFSTMPVFLLLLHPRDAQHITANTNRQSTRQRLLSTTFRIPVYSDHRLSRSPSYNSNSGLYKQQTVIASCWVHVTVDELMTSYSSVTFLPTTYALTPFWKRLPVVARVSGSSTQEHSYQSSELHSRKQCGATVASHRKKTPSDTFLRGTWLKIVVHLRI